MTYGDFDDFNGPTEPLKQTDTLIIAEVGQPSRYVSVEQPVVTLGRSVDNDIVLQDPQVSRLHARILRDARGVYTIEDLDSRNGTYLDGVRLFPNRPQRWSESQEVRAGPYYIKLVRLVQWSADQDALGDEADFYGSAEDETKVGEAIRDEDFYKKARENPRRADAKEEKELNVDETRPEFLSDDAPGLGGFGGGGAVGGISPRQNEMPTNERPTLEVPITGEFNAQNTSAEAGEKKVENAAEQEAEEAKADGVMPNSPAPAKPIAPIASPPPQAPAPSASPSPSPLPPPPPKGMLEEAPPLPPLPASAPIVTASEQPSDPEPNFQPTPRGSAPSLQQQGRGQINADVAQETQFAAYYPREMVSQIWLPMTAYIFRASAAETVAKDAEKQLGGLISVMRRVAQVARRAIPSGTMVTATPYLPGFQFNPPQITVGFYEEWHRFDFKMRPVDAPSNQSANGLLTFTVDGIIVADVPLSVFISTEETTATGENLLTTQKLYDSIFCSYSHTDTAIIERVERVYRSLGFDFLRDVHTLRSGQHWSDEIYAMIDKADIFQLFWSQTAAESAYVEKEWRYALKLNRDGKNFIRPVYWQAPMPNVPNDLGHIHFAYEPELDH